ncbi:MAG TPA: N-acetyl-gamma-glutamyl-phosphate reductase [archaeon]|nr:N-acetyl-gamma-glutamyl-phosphate reductase [archaeon]
MIKVGIYGATGYTGYELVKILLGHPQVELAFMTSETYQGQALSEVFPCGIEKRLVASGDADPSSVEAIFTCLPHTTAMELIAKVYRTGLKVIDLSADFRFTSPADYQRWYDVEHLAPELLGKSAYGLCELFRDEIKACDIVGNPGCYPTGTLLALAPAVRAGLLALDEVIVDAKTGISGAGRKSDLTTQFVEVNENLIPYKIGRVHRHVGEMEGILTRLAGREVKVVFTPQLAPLSRGILFTIYISAAVKPGKDTRETAEEIRSIYEKAYRSEPFVRVLERGKPAQLGYVERSNACVIGVHEAAHTSFTVITAAIDNLIKGGAGQAVQNFNILFGLDETTGLAASSPRI